MNVKSSFAVFHGLVIPDKTAWILALLICLVALAGCGGGKAKVVEPELPITVQPGEPQWLFGSNGIQIKLQATGDLNTYEGQPHTAVICAYQLTDPNEFNNLRKKNDGLLKLLECKNFGAGAAGAQRIIVQPGETRTVFMDRGKDVKHIGLVAGFYNLDSNDASLLLDIPLTVFKKGLIFKDVYQIPATLQVDISLSDKAMRKVEH